MEDNILDKDLLVEKNEIQHEYAGFWIRTGASLIDLVVYLPIIGINIYNLNSLKSLPLQIFTTVLLMVYKPWMEFQYGSTLGKMAVRVKVVSRDSDSISIQQAVIRNAPGFASQILAMITTVLLFMHPDFQTVSSMDEVANLEDRVFTSVPEYVITSFYMISCFAVAFNANKQALHDSMAGTFCIRS
jgi:uncharacterized RDD family membrane protein YckC